MIVERPNRVWGGKGTGYQIKNVWTRAMPPIAFHGGSSSGRPNPADRRGFWPFLFGSATVRFGSFCPCSVRCFTEQKPNKNRTKIDPPSTPSNLPKTFQPAPTCKKNCVCGRLVVTVSFRFFRSGVPFRPISCPGRWGGVYQGGA